MGWNGSGDKNAAPVPQKAERKTPPSKWRGLVALLVIVVGGLAAWFALRPAAQEKAEEPAPVKPRKIAETKKKVATNVVAKAEKEAPKEPEKIDINKVYRDENGHVIFHPEFPVGSPANPIRLAPVVKPGNILPPKKLYDTFAENYIVGLMRTKPGMPVVGVTLPPNFDEQFIARIADPVGIKDDDTEEDIALRKEMVEFKKEMAQLIADGRKPSEVILEEREKLRKLSETRGTMLREISDMRKNGASQDDIDITVEAANKILAEKGIEKIKIPALLRKTARDAAQGGGESASPADAVQK